MPGYRLMFNISNPNVTMLADALVDADYALGEAVSALEGGLIDHNFLTRAHGVTQFIIRFNAEDDETANRLANAAVRGAQRIAPVDNISLHRRSSRYVAVF